MPPWVGRSPYRPQKLDGMRTEPPGSVPSAVSSPPATAEADPLEEAAGHQIGRPGVQRRAEEAVDAEQAERVAGGCVASQSGLPVTVPRTSNKSLAANVRSASGPVGAPWMDNIDVWDEGAQTIAHEGPFRLAERSPAPRMARGG